MDHRRHLPQRRRRPRRNFRFRFNVLPGDATRDGIVNALDLGDIKRRLSREVGDGATGSNAYSAFADANADGRINALDVAFVKQRLTDVLPGPDPSSAAAVQRSVPRVAEELLGPRPVLA